MTGPQNFETLLADLSKVTEIRALTALRYREDRAERTFTSHPEVFSNVGFKLFADAPTMAHVRDSNAPVLTEGAAAIRAGFPDGQTILDLGADAIVNLPVRAQHGDAVGQLNLMGRAGAFEAHVVEALQAVADSYACCFLSTDPKGEAKCD